MENRYKAKQIGEIEGLGLIYQTYAPLHEQILSFQKEGIRHPFLVTPEETAMIRLAGLSNDFTRTCIAPVRVKGKVPILFKPSIFMDPLMAEAIIRTHSRYRHLTQDRVFYEVLEDRAKIELNLDPEDRTAQALQSAEDYDLTPEMDDTRFLIGKPTAKYFKRFKHPSIRLLNLSVPKVPEVPENKCIVSYLWFDRPENAGFCCWDGYGDLGSEDGAFGVLRTGETGTKNLGYSLTKVRDAVARAIPEFCAQKGITKLEEILGPLEKRILETLRKQEQ